jgi:polyhydroxyalkanoate synthesis regulator phasin|tara:strand:+ start:1063 stop:1314 length:252 start_codon:yes stop_codon:yes gene_type:complete
MNNKNIERRIKKLEEDSHPPVNWKELIHSNIERIEELETVNDKLIDIIKSLTSEKKELKERVEILEKIITDLFPPITEDEIPF